ncbi:MAG: nitroreductase family protein [Planctomycetota bacterium]
MEPVTSGSSVREYREDPLEEKALVDLLRAAMAAPSAGDERPWQFLVIRSPSVRKQLAEMLPEAHMVSHAPVAILPCGDTSRQKHVGFWVTDCAAATQTILIEAERMGLGAIWLGIYPIKGRVRRIRDFLNIPQHIVPFALVAVGHPAESRDPHDRFDPSRVHLETW